MSGKRKTIRQAYEEGWRDRLKRAFYQSALIADSHRATHLDSGDVTAAASASSVAAFIVQQAREWSVWNDSLAQPLILAECEKGGGE